MCPPGVSHREADDRDDALIAALINEAFAPAERFLYEGPRINTEGIREKLRTGRFLLDIDAQDRLRGCVYVQVNRDTGYFGLLAVSPCFQKMGVARALVASAESFCRLHGCRTVEIVVVSHRRELFPFYSALGYTASGTRPFEYEKLRLPSHFVVMVKPLDG